MRNVNGAMLLRFHKWALVAVTLLGGGLVQNAYAQSTGTEAAEEDLSEVVVSATRVRNVGIIGEQNAPKSRISLSGEYLQKQVSGQSVFQALNQVPGVTFTNSDPYGTSGGNLRIRGFDGSRVSVTFDGVPLNDSGNYALFTNQMLDSELIDRVDVNLGTTDVDSPTASATGGTVAYRTRKPTDEFGGQAVLSGGQDNYKRAFVRVDSGEFGPWGTKAFVAASYQNYDKFKGPGELEKKQFNAVVRQDFENENFISLAFHYNVNRNAFYRTTSKVNFALFGRDYENLATCTRDAPTAGGIDNENASPVATIPNVLLNTDNPANPSSCTNYFGVRINPSDTGNIRMQSLWHLGDKFRLTFDPSFQYVLANGGGTTTMPETAVAFSSDIRVRGSSAAAGVDLNGDGDLLDTVRFYTPNTTNTNRFGATASLIWDFNDNNLLRFAYTYDRARHRQTGEWGPMSATGVPENVFAGNEGDQVLAADGDVIRGRDRKSVAELSQYALEYRGQFMEDKFTATLGVRAPYFTRELNQYCYTPNGGNGSSGTIGVRGGVLCTSRQPISTLANGNVTFVPPANAMTPAVDFIPPYSETVKFDDILPSAGLTFKPWESHMFYLSYAEGLSAPRTDNLYAVVRNTDGSLTRPTPESETTKAYDLGWRLNAGSTIASVALYRIDYTNRIVSTFNIEKGYSEDRNVGDAKIQGVDAQIGHRFGSALTLTGSASFNDSELLGSLDPNLNGKQLVETPKWTYAARADIDVTDNFHIGAQAKKVGNRFGTDNNDEVSPGYTVVDLDLNYEFKVPGFDRVQLQFNVTNLLDEEYFGNISSGTGGTSVAFYSIGAPRTAVASIRFDF
ncbi:MAG TPA: TonB-dependent receptor [Steroidobacteraceae bacterium]|jgi:iron complex outermembrane receptor protein|nr:TonB-dependent receptor [Steroidobacteraceae bacterium]